MLNNREKMKYLKMKSKWHNFGIGVSIIFTIFPIVRMTYLIASTGTNVVSNDLEYYLKMVDAFLSGNYDWRNLFLDSFNGSHLTAFFTIIRLFLIKIYSWNVYAELYLCIALFIGQLILFYNVLKKQVNTPILQWFLLPLLSLAIFSPVHLNVFSFGESALGLSGTMFGVTLGIWSLTTFPNCLKGIIIASFGGLMAAWSWGSGVMTLPIFLLGLLLLKFRKIHHYIVASLATLIILAPYLYFFVLKSRSTGNDTKLFDFFLLFKAIGYPFTYGDQLVEIGIIAISASGIFLLAIAAIILWQKRHTIVLYKATPPILLTLFGLLGTWQITIFRRGFAPWYITQFMSFWIGLLGIYYILYATSHIGVKSHSRIDRIFASPHATRLWSLFGFSVITFLVIISSPTYADKAFYLYSRSPASASCLREYQTAPTYCEQYVFQGGHGSVYHIPSMGKILEKHQLSVFTSPRKYILQGDFILDTVTTKSQSNQSKLYWSSDRGKTILPWYDFRHLNLVLSPQKEIFWEITFPKNMQKATFHSAIALSQLHAKTPLVFTLSIEETGKTPQEIFSKTWQSGRWSPLSIPLDRYAGKTVTLHLTTHSDRDFDNQGIYRYPYIEIALTEQAFSESDTNIIYSNTDLSTNFVQTSDLDWKFSIKDTDSWEKIGLKANGKSPWLFENTNLETHLKYLNTLNIPLFDYSHFYLQLAISPAIYPQSVKIYYRLQGQEDFEEARSVKIPLIPDGKVHSYSYKLDLLELSSNDRLTGLLIKPLVWHPRVSFSTTKTNNWIELIDFRLIGR